MIPWVAMSAPTLLAKELATRPMIQSGPAGPDHILTVFLIASHQHSHEGCANIHYA